MTIAPSAFLDLTDRISVVTGAARGIGAAAGEALAAMGSTVVLAVREKTDEIESRAETLSGLHGRPVDVIESDVTDEPSVAALYQSVFKAHKRLDVLVNNAGVMEDAPVGMSDPAAVQRVIDTNLVGTINHCRYAARLMARKKRVSIINVSSILGTTGAAGQSAYAASKAGVIGLTRSLAKELGPQGIRVNAVAPGFIETDMTAGFDADKREELVARTALARLGEPGDVAAAIAFLASDASAFVTGQVLGVDGGLVV